jgi:hypothetical protein
MTLYCGIDLHATISVVAVLDDGDRTIYEKRLANDLRTIIAVLDCYRRSNGA